MKRTHGLGWSLPMGAAMVCLLSAPALTQDVGVGDKVKVVGMATVR